MPEALVVTEKILLTGRPGCGKTTLIKRIVNNLPRCAGGFFTEELRAGSSPTAFKIVTLDGEQAVFAHVDLKTPQYLGNTGLIFLPWKESASVQSVMQSGRGGWW